MKKKRIHNCFNCPYHSWGIGQARTAGCNERHGPAPGI